MISVVVESKNEAHESDEIACLVGLSRQTYPLDEVEIVVAGDRRKINAFRKQAAGLPFAAVREVELRDGSYFGCKHAGASIAAGEILIFLDWDVEPAETWLAAAVHTIRSGAAVSSGPAVFRWSRLSPWNPLMLAASSITWSRDFFEANNAAFDAAAYRAHPYRPEDGRLGWLGQLESLRREGARLERTPEQRVLHWFTPRWWFLDFNFRAGVETVRLHWRMAASDEPLTPLQHILLSSGPLQPALNFAWGVAGDAPRWLRYSRFLGLSRPRRALGVPLVVAVSAAAHTFQVAGMIAARLAPGPMIRFSDSR